MSSPDLAELVIAAQRGDEQAFEALVRRFYGTVNGIALVKTGDWSAAEDLTQEVFVSAWKHFDKLESPWAFFSWLCTITTNLSNNWSRSEAYRRSLAQRRAAPSVDSITSTLAETSELREELDFVLNKLPEATREVIVLHYFEELPVATIAEILGISVSASKKRLQRGRAMLRDTLESHWKSQLGVLRSPERREKGLRRVMGGLALGPVFGQDGLPLGAEMGGAAANAEWLKTLIIGGVAMSQKKLVAGLCVLALLMASLGFLVFDGQDILRRMGLAETGRDASSESGQTTTAPLLVAGSEMEEAEADGVEVDTESSPLPDEEVADDAGFVLVLDRDETGESDDEEEPSSIRGYVLNEFGQFVAGAAVKLLVMSGDNFTGHEGRYVTVSDDDGQFQIEGIRNQGQGAMTASIDGALGMELIALSESRNIEGVQIVVKTGVSLTGRVLTHEGVPVAGALVWSMMWVGETRSDEGESDLASFTDVEGYFEIFFPEPGTTTLMVLTEVGEGVFLVEIGTGEIVELRLEEPGTVSGTITHHDGSPVQDVVVEVQARFEMDAPNRANPRNESRVYMAETSFVGAYALDNVLPGHAYSVQVYSTSGNSGLRSPRLEIGFLNAGEDRIWDYVFDEFLVVTGHVFGRQSGRPIPQAAALLVGGDVEDNFALADDDGRFTLRHAGQPGEYSITASYSTLAGDAIPGGEAQVIELSYGGATEIDLYVDDPYARTFRFVDGFGQNVAGVTAITWWTGPDGARGGKGRTTSLGPSSEDGLVRYDGFAPVGEYALSIRVQGSSWQRSLPFSGEAGVDYPVEDIVVYRFGGMEGVALTSSGEPIRNEELVVQAFRDGERLTEFRVRTTGDGYFFTENQVPATTVSLTFSNSMNEAWQSDLIEFPAELVSDLGSITLGAARQKYRVQKVASIPSAP